MLSIADWEVLGRFRKEKAVTHNFIVAAMGKCRRNKGTGRHAPKFLGDGMCVPTASRNKNLSSIASYSSSHKNP